MPPDGLSWPPVPTSPIVARGVSKSIGGGRFVGGRVNPCPRREMPGESASRTACGLQRGNVACSSRGGTETNMRRPLAKGRKNGDRSPSFRGDNGEQETGGPVGRVVLAPVAVKDRSFLQGFEIERSRSFCRCRQGWAVVGFGGHPLKDQKSPCLRRCPGKRSQQAWQDCPRTLPAPAALPAVGSFLRV